MRSFLIYNKTNILNEIYNLNNIQLQYKILILTIKNIKYKNSFINLYKFIN